MLTNRFVLSILLWGVVRWGAINTGRRLII